MLYDLAFRSFYFCLTKDWFIWDGPSRHSKMWFVSSVAYLHVVNGA